MTSSEKKSFYRFLGLYFSSSILLIFSIGILMYIFESQNIINHHKERMQNIALKTSASIISSFMNEQELSIKEQKDFTITLYDKNKKKIFGALHVGIDFEKTFYETKDKAYFIDQSSQLHHGVKYLVVEGANSKKQIDALLKKIFFVCIFAIVIIMLVGYFLGKMFLKPIQNERVKLDNFIKDTTHELNTPISALLMSISKLKQQNIDAKILQRVEISAQRINMIYSNLTYLLLEEKYNKNAQAVDLKEIVEKEIQLYEDLAQKKEIKIIKNISSSKVVIDEESAKRVVGNLISNAIKYNKHGGYIDIYLDPKKMVIKDSGIGIEAQNIDKIFHRYFRVSNFTGGFGLGMDIVNTICKKYNIKIHVDSEINKSTTITLEFC